MNETNKYCGPMVQTTVDVAIVDYETEMVLLGRKKNQTKFQFIGGFAEVTSPSFESDAIREVEEETGLTVTHLIYIGSKLINDERFINQKDKIKTLFFCTIFYQGTAIANDDIEEIKWFRFQDIRNNIVEKHYPLDDLLKEHIAFLVKVDYLKQII